jgi:pyrimidine-nucleoside phosphorylase
VTPAPGGVAALIAEYCAGGVEDGEMTRWLRDVCERGMPLEETCELALAMAHSGEVIDWSGVDGPIVDKHSTGGVGDAVTLVAVPLAAACGAKVAKLSGRALGHTGGTIDKLESVPGLRADLTVEEFKSQVARIGCAVSAASARLAPADKKLYALRHKTGTVASVPLIAASVMSKKIAAGASAIALDVKFGRGAFMASIDEARLLADTMRAIGERAGLRVVTLLTSMDEPLADSVGDALELDEALSLLEGRSDSAALRETAVAVAEAMLEAAELPIDEVSDALAGGRAHAKFCELIAAQGGRLAAFERSWPPGRVLRAQRTGVVAQIDARVIGEIVAHAKESLPSEQSRRIGVRLRKRTGSRVVEGEGLLSYWLPDADERVDDAVVVSAQ